MEDVVGVALGVVTVSLIVSVWFRTPVMVWSVLTVVLFGGIWGHGLTHAQRGSHH